MSEALNREPTTEERMYLEIMQKMHVFLNKCVADEDLPDNSKTLIKLKSALFSSAALIYEFASENSMDDQAIDSLLNQCQEWLASGVKGIRQGADFAQSKTN